jgi:hypothetical protein
MQDLSNLAAVFFHNSKCEITLKMVFGSPNVMHYEATQVAVTSICLDMNKVDSHTWTTAEVALGCTKF